MRDLKRRRWIGMMEGRWKNREAIKKEERGNKRELQQIKISYQWREISRRNEEVKGSQSVLCFRCFLIKHAPLQFKRRCCRGNHTRVKGKQAWGEDTRTHAHTALWLAHSIIDQPWGHCTWRRARRRSCSILCPLPLFSGVFITFIGTLDLWPLTSSNQLPLLLMM